MTTANDNSTPNRIRNALREDAIQAAQRFADLPAGAQTSEAYAEALSTARPYLDYIAVVEQMRPVDIEISDAELASEGRNTGFAVEFRHDTRPSVDETLAAYADGLRCFYRRSPTGKVERFVGGIQHHTTDDAVTIGGHSDMGRFYGLHFHRGALVHFGQNGRREAAIDEQTVPRGPDADNDNFAFKQTTANPGVPVALEEMRRRLRAETALGAMEGDAARLLDVIFQADSYAEVAKAAGLKPTSHNGRRATIRILREANNLIAA